MPFYEEQRGIFERGRGCGYWLWKPYIILEALRNAGPDDVIVYWDVGRGKPNTFTRPITPLVKWSLEHNGMLPGVLIGPHGPWTKRDCFHYMGCDSPKFWNARQVQATFSIWSGKRAVEFVEEWLHWCKDRRCLTDDPNECGLPNLPGFREHRHDQSILTNLCIKHGIEALDPLPIAPGMWTKNMNACAESLERPAVVMRALAPDQVSAEALRAKVIELRKNGRVQEALAELERAVRAFPNHPEAYFRMAEIHRDARRYDLAAGALRQAVKLKGDYCAAWIALAIALRQLGRAEEAVEACERAVQLKPEDPASHINLGNALHDARNLTEAAAAFEHALTLDPRHVAAMNNYGMLLMDMNKPGEAIKQFCAGLAIESDRAELHTNLGNIYRKQGRIEQAIECYRRTLAIRPDSPHVHSNMLFAMNCLPRADQGLLAEHVDWAQRHAAKFYLQTPSPQPSPGVPGEGEMRRRSQESLGYPVVPANRRLRVGYVSPDFRTHSVAYFIGPVIAGHNRANVEVFCYSNVRRPDQTTRAIRASADHWREIAGRSDDFVADLIRKDGIDILVDLAGHTADHRLLVLARRAAPVQVTYLGYPNTTGLATMDYRITDAASDPPGMTESHYTEKLVRLPNGFLCYAPPADTPEPRTSIDDGAIAFGSFNNLSKLTASTIQTWASILLKVPRSKLLLKAQGLAGETCAWIKTSFAAHGIDVDRIELLGPEPTFQKHLLTYHRVDIALDTFPYHGTTTTCEAL